MGANNYKASLKKIAWGYVFLYLNINLGPVDILPGWVGLILLLLALDGIAEKEPSAKLLKPFAFILIAVELTRWVVVWFSGIMPTPWISVITGIIGLYFHFQLLTNIADVALRNGSVYGKRIRLYRNLQILLVAVLSMMEAAIIPPTWVSFSWMMILLTAILIIGLIWTLFRYKNEPEIQMQIPPYVQDVLDALTDNGHEAYIVGGCVRDALMGKVPNDWDVCTSALPEENKAVFADRKTIDTGMKHGTVTVLMEEHPIEITTYRIDGDYKDGRHPEQVEFTRSLSEDLARRDFTINAMAYHPSKGVIDIYHGRDDLQRGLIRCVGAPDKRFREDALRIMRGLRFASTLYFAIDPETAEAMFEEKEGLCQVSRERINVELSKLLLGRRSDSILNQYMEILEVAAPGIRLPATPLSQLPENLPIRLAEVFPKDTGKYLRQLKYDGNTIRLARVLSRMKDKPALTEPKKEMVRCLQKHGETITILHYAREGQAEVQALYKLLKQKPCYRTGDLAVNGNDLLEIGVSSGPEMGEILKKLLDMVIEEEIENRRDVLLEAAKEAIKHE